MNFNSKNLKIKTYKEIKRRNDAIGRPDIYLYVQQTLFKAEKDSIHIINSRSGKNISYKFELFGEFY